MPLLSRLVMSSYRCFVWCNFCSYNKIFVKSNHHLDGSVRRLLFDRKVITCYYPLICRTRNPLCSPSDCHRLCSWKINRGKREWVCSNWYCRKSHLDICSESKFDEKGYIFLKGSQLKARENAGMAGVKKNPLFMIYCSTRIANIANFFIKCILKNTAASDCQIESVLLQASPSYHFYVGQTKAFVKKIT